MSSGSESHAQRFRINLVMKSHEHHFDGILSRCTFMHIDGANTMMFYTNLL